MSNLRDDLIMLGGISAFFFGLWKQFTGTPVEVRQGVVTAGQPSVVLSFAAASYAAPSGVDTLARTIWGEARGDGVRGMEAVAAVVMNRVRSPKYSSRLLIVCLQKYQFSAWLAGDPNRMKMQAVTEADPNFKAARAIALRAAKGQLSDPTGGALHYYANSIAPPYWAEGAKISARIGHHIFMTGVA